MAFRVSYRSFRQFGGVTRLRLFATVVRSSAAALVECILIAGIGTYLLFMRLITNT
jgi:hypothetical protein